MISGTFHVTSQQWRYFSREKAIIHTLHLGQLTPYQPGNTILIESTPPIAQGASNVKSFSVPPLTQPQGQPGSIVNLTFNTTVLCTCYGSVGINKKILTQKNMDIQFSSWRPDEMRFLMTPHESGWYFVYVEAQSDRRDPSAGYWGPGALPGNFAGQAGDVQVIVQKAPFNGTQIQQVCTNDDGISQYGPFDGQTTPTWHWGPALYITYTSVVRKHAVTVVSAGQALEFKGVNLGNAPDAYLSGYMFKVADL